MINLITNSSYIVFYPIYAMSICITALIILNAIVETGSRFPYFILFTIAAIFMLYLSFFFKKFYHHINEIGYYKWTTISFPILIGVLILISNGIYVINNLLNCRKYTTEDWIQEFFPFISWYTLLMTTSYLDDSYFKSFWWVYDHILYIVFLDLSTIVIGHNISLFLGMHQKMIQDLE